MCVCMCVFFIEDTFSKKNETKNNVFDLILFHFCFIIYCLHFLFFLKKKSTFSSVKMQSNCLKEWLRAATIWNTLWRSNCLKLSIKLCSASQHHLCLVQPVGCGEMSVEE